MRIVRAREEVADVAGLVARMRGPLLMARENGRFIPYYDVANSDPTSHEVWIGGVAFTTSTVAKSILISVASEGDRVGKCQQ